MTEMVERVARAISPHAFALFEAGGPCEDLDRQACEAARNQARAAIAAMRHPARDAAMMNAGMKAVIFGGSPDSVAWNVFHVMIDAALATSSPPP